MELESAVRKVLQAETEVPEAATTPFGPGLIYREVCVALAEPRGAVLWTCSSELLSVLRLEALKALSLAHTALACDGLLAIHRLVEGVGALIGMDRWKAHTDCQDCLYMKWLVEIRDNNFTGRHYSACVKHRAIPLFARPMLVVQRAGGEWREAIECGRQERGVTSRNLELMLLAVLLFTAFHHSLFYEKKRMRGCCPTIDMTVSSCSLDFNAYNLQRSLTNFVWSMQP